jgi:hypothetical protein
MSWLGATGVCHGWEKNRLKFRNKFLNFRSSTKFYMNFYWLKLDLARLNLTDIPDVRYIYFIFLEPRTHQDLLNEICFTVFRLQFKFVQNLETLLEFATKLEICKGLTATWAGSAWQPVRTGMPGPQPMQVGTTYDPQLSGVQALRPCTGALQGSTAPARRAAGRRQLPAARRSTSAVVAAASMSSGTGASARLPARTSAEQGDVGSSVTDAHRTWLRDVEKEEHPGRPLTHSAGAGASSGGLNGWSSRLRPVIDSRRRSWSRDARRQAAAATARLRVGERRPNGGERRCSTNKRCRRAAFKHGK